MKEIKLIIKEQTEKGYKLTTAKFFRQIGICRRRWNQILNGEIEPRLSEIKSISNFFNVDINKIINE